MRVFTQRSSAPPGYEPPGPSCCCCSRVRGGSGGCSGRSCGPPGWKPHRPQTEPWRPGSETPPLWTGLCTSPAKDPPTLNTTWELERHSSSSFKSLLFSSRSSTTDQPLHHLVHQQLLLCSGQHEEVMRLLNNHGPQSVHHVSGELLDGAHPRTAKWSDTFC